jgi:S-adenosylmethionine decarboxylase
VIKSHHFSAILPASPMVFSWQSADFIQVLKQAAQTAGLTVVGELAVTFQPQGVSAVVLLAESHIALHFWPEAVKVTIDIHICDYQQENLPKAQMLTEILTQAISGSDKNDFWHYLSIND